MHRVIADRKGWKSIEAEETMKTETTHSVCQWCGVDRDKLDQRNARLVEALKQLIDYMGNDTHLPRLGWELLCNARAALAENEQANGR